MGPALPVLKYSRTTSRSLVIPDLAARQIVDLLWSNAGNDERAGPRHETRSMDTGGRDILPTVLVGSGICCGCRMCK